MKRWTAWMVALALAGALPVCAASPDYLIRAEKSGSFALAGLLDTGIPVVMDLERCILVLGGDSEIDALKGLGLQSEILDTSPTYWNYYHVGLRPDSDLRALMAVGSVIHTEDNWVILRVPPEADLADLYKSRAFFAPVPRERLAKPKPGDPLPLHGPETLHNVPLVQQMVDSVSTANIDAVWNTLAPPNGTPTPTRYTTDAGCGDDSTYCYNLFASYGLWAEYDDYGGASRAPNAYGTLTGAVTPSKVYIVEGHLDDMPSSGYAPGADDNASGTVVVLEAARVLSCYAFKSTVKFLAVTGEETGLEGSEAYANAAAARDEDIQGVINMDMPGWTGDNSPVGENLDLNCDSNSQALGLFFAQCAADYSTGLAVDAFLCPSLTASDHYPFWQQGYKAVCGITDNEGYCSHAGHYPYYHTSDDTIANCGDKTFFYNAVRTSVAALAELAEPFKITFDRASYGCAVPVTVIVGDRDLNTSSSSTQTATIQIWSTREGTPEDLVLTEQGANSMLFKGTISLTGASPVHGDGLLSVNSGDALTARYVDALDCDGATAVTYDAAGTVSTDCTPPVISNVLSTGVTDTAATITWTTDEPANSRATYGTSVPPGTTADDPLTYVTSHSLTLSGLAPCTTYRFSVSSEDAVGNGATDTNGGAYYVFTTLGRTAVFGPDDVEGGAGSWVVSGGSAATQWHIDTCRSNSATHAWKAGASDAPTCSADYVNSVDTYLTSGTISLGAAGHGYHLRYKEWYDTESNTGCTYDPLRPQVSTDGGTSWTTLGTQYCGASGGWVSKDFDLASFTGSNVRIRFHFHSDSYVTAEGWYVDDIDISRSAGCVPTLERQSHSFTDACSGTGSGVGNGYVDPGEDITVPVTLENTGMQDATNVSATLSTVTPGITVTTATAIFPNIAANGGTGLSDSPHFVYRVDPSVACGTVINFNLHAVCTEDPVGTDSAFTMTVGQVVPGGGTALDEAFATGNPPTGWTVVDGGSGGGAAATWTTANPGSRTATAPIATPFMIVDSDYAGSSATQDEQLITPVMNLGAATSVTLEFDQYFNYYSGYGDEYGDVDVRSGNTGGSWVNVFRNHGADSANPDHRSINITTQAAGASDVQVRFHYYGGAYDYYWMLDNVKVTYAAPGGCNVSPCTPSVTPPGETGGTAATHVKWISGTKDCMEWGENAAAAHYHLYRGEPGHLADLLDGDVDSCKRLDDVMAENCTGVAEDPPAGSFYWYLVTGWNAGGDGSAGNATGGPRTLNSSGPCP